MAGTATAQQIAAQEAAKKAADQAAADKEAADKAAADQQAAIAAAVQQALANQPPVNVTIQQQDRAGDAAKSMAEAKALAMDTTIPGGRYLVGGVLVDADGKAIKDKTA